MWTTGNDWYEHQKQFDTLARASSEGLIEKEQRVFADGMSSIANCFDSAIELQPIPNDLVTKRKLGLISHGFNLLWSAWDAVLAGRCDAAVNHWRSIEEIPDFLLSLVAEPSCAERWAEPEWNVAAARRVVRKGLESEMSGTGKEWLKRRQRAAKSVQALSHVSIQAQGMGLGIGTSDGVKIGVLKPGGAPSLPMLVNASRYLAISAADLAMSVSFSLSRVPGLAAMWDEPTARRILSWAAAVPTATPPGSLPGEVESIIVLRTDAEPPDPVAVAGVDVAAAEGQGT